MAQATIYLDVNTQNAINAINRFTANAQTSINRLGNSMTAIFAGVAIGSFIKDAVNAYDIQEKAVAGVKAALISTQGIAGKTLDGLLADASALQKTSLFGDEEILTSVTQQLLTFSNISGKVFDKTQQAALDLATRLGTDLRSQTIQLGKALNDPIKGIGALSRAGVQFSDEQKKQIKLFVETNNVMAAQNMILGELELQFGGAAEAAAKAGAGPLTQLQMRFADITEIIGDGLMPIINGLLIPFTALSGVIETNNNLFKDVITTTAIFAGILGGVALGIKLVTAAQWLWNIAMTANPIGIIIVGIAALIAIGVVLAKRFDGWGKSFGAMWEIMKLRLDNFGLYFKAAFVTLEFAVKVWFTGVKSYFTGLWEIAKATSSAIKAVWEGNFSEAGDIMKKALSDSAKGASDAIKKLNAERKNSIDHIQFEITNNKTLIRQQKELIGLTRTGAGIIDTSGVDKGTTGGANILPPDDISGTAKSSGVRSVTVNIGSIVENQSITQNEDPLIVADMFERALLNVIGDTTVLAA